MNGYDVFEACYFKKVTIFHQMGSLESIKILGSDEGRMLRTRHQANVSYLWETLFDAGIWALHPPSHIIPVHVS